MYRYLPIAAVAILAAGPSFANGACATGPSASFKPIAQLTSKLQADGLTVRRVKTEGGCYEVYAVDKSGAKVNAAFNAVTFAQVYNAEAGEN